MDQSDTKVITDSGASKKIVSSPGSEEEITPEQRRLMREHAEYVRLHKKPL
jgi:hypothetical protein